MIKRITRSVIAIVLTILMMGAVVPVSPVYAASSYYVATNGNDNNPGTLSEPFLTLAKGFSALAPGDTLYIRGGTYVEQRVNVTTSGTASAYIRVQNYPGETVIFDGQNTTDPNINGVSVKFETVSYWNISGITMVNWICAGIYIYNSSYINISDMVIHDVNNPYEVSENPYGSEGILGEGSTYVTVYNTEIYNVGVTSPQSRKTAHVDHAAYLGYNSNHWTFGYDNFHDTIGCGIQFYAGESHTMDGGSYSYVYNSIFYNNTMSGILLSDNTQSYIINNTFCGNGGDDLDFYSHVTNNSIYNNIFGSNLASGCYHLWWRDSTSVSNVLDYNSYRIPTRAVYKSGTSYSFTSWQGLGYDVHSVSGDPSFLDEASHDFKVHGASNTLGMATAAYAPMDDYVSHLRQTVGEDMGAYDYNDAYDNFEGYSPSTYTTIGGTWSITTDGTNVYSQTQAWSGPSYKALTGSTSWTNYNITANVKVVGSGTTAIYNAGVVGRANSAGTIYYLALIRPSEVDLYKNVNGTWTTLGYYSASYPTNTRYTLMLGMNGSTITVSVNGTQRIKVRDTAITSGQTGFYTEYTANFDEYFVAPIR